LTIVQQIGRPTVNKRYSLQYLLACARSNSPIHHELHTTNCHCIVQNVTFVIKGKEQTHQIHVLTIRNATFHKAKPPQMTRNPAKRTKEDLRKRKKQEHSGNYLYCATSLNGSEL
jgi:hypothetical protein